MKTVISENKKTIHIDELHDGKCIIAKNKQGTIVGMIIKENNGYILKVDCICGNNGYYHTIKGCIESCDDYEYTFFVA